MHGLKLKRRSRPQFYAPLAQEKAILQTQNIEGWNRIHNFPQLEMIAKWPNRSTEYYMLLQGEIRKTTLGTCRIRLQSKVDPPHPTPDDHFQIMSSLLCSSLPVFSYLPVHTYMNKLAKLTDVDHEFFLVSYR